MPTLACRCNYIHSFSQIPDESWITILHENFDSITSSSLGNEEKLDTLYSESSSINLCAEWERLTWAKKGNVNFAIYIKERPNNWFRSLAGMAKVRPPTKRYVSL